MRSLYYPAARRMARRVALGRNRSVQTLGRDVQLVATLINFLAAGLVVIALVLT